MAPDDDLRAAVLSGNVEKARAALDGGANVECTLVMPMPGAPPPGWVRTALSVAVEKGHLEVVELLLDKGADKDAKDAFVGMAALHHAVSHSGPTVGRNGVMLSFKCHPEMTQLLLDRGAAVDIQDSMGGTPLHYAVQVNLKEIAILLLAKGASKTVKRNDGQTALDLVGSGDPLALGELLR